MSKTYKSDVGRFKLVKLPDRYTGWLGESCWRSRGKRFLKKLQHRALRRFFKKEIAKECPNLGQD